MTDPLLSTMPPISLTPERIVELYREQSQLLERVARGEGVTEVLTTLALLLEEQIPRSFVSIQFVDGDRIRTGVGPSLSPAYLAKMDGLPVGAYSGWCGAAAHSGKIVVCDDVASDPRWPECRQVALEAGLRSCWSVPVTGADGSVLGTLATHHDVPRSPGKEEFEFARAASHLAALVIERDKRERALRGSQERSANYYRGLADTSPGITWVTDEDGAMIFLSRRWEEETGQTREQGLGLGWAQAVHPDEREEFVGKLREFTGLRDPFSVDARTRRKDGEYRWSNVSGRPHYDAAGTYIGYVGSVVDIHDRVVQTLQLERMAEFRRSVMEMIEEGLSSSDAGQFYNRMLERAVNVIPGAQAGSLLLLEDDGLYSFAAVNGYDFDELRDVRFTREAAGFGTQAGPHPRAVAHPITHDSVLDTSQAALVEHGRSTEIKSVLVVPIVIEDELKAYLTLDNFDDMQAFGSEAIETARLFAAHCGSLIKRFELEAQLNRLAFEDSLTGLPNRAMLMGELDRILAVAAQSHDEAALLFVDLDNLKPINDLLGHKAGDEVLSRVAGRLRECAPEDAFLARLSGDEFTFVITGGDVQRRAVALAQQVLARLGEPICLGERDVQVGASIGMSIYPHDSADGDDLLRHADIAMYHSKQNGKHSFTVFQREMEAAPLERLLLEEALLHALENDEFILHFQPRIDMLSGRAVCFEALVRWQHPQRGLIMPNLFIPLAETTNLIHPLGKRILELALEQVKAWRDLGHHELKVAVNLSAGQLERSDFVDELSSMLRSSGVPGTALEVEILERVAMTNLSVSARNLTRLKELGVSIALDDFGTGYSSLSYLQELPIDTLKIDRSFLRSCSSGKCHAGTHAVMKAITGMGGAFGMRVVAEGVESGDQWNCLKQIGCDEAQGYLFSRPVPAAEVSLLLERDIISAPV